MAKSSKPKTERRQIDGNKVNTKLKSRNPVIPFDSLQIYMGLPHTIDLEGIKGKITVYSPTMGQVIKLGFNKFYSGINPFISNTTMYRLPLWEMGVDWNDLSDFDLFCLLIQSGLDKEVTDLFFDKDIDWSKFQLVAKYDEDGNAQRALYNEDSDIEINEEVYFHLSQYIRKVVMRDPEEKITNDPNLKLAFIMKDKRHKANMEIKAKSGEDESGLTIQTLISTCVNHPGFKYKKSEIMEIGINEFFDSVKRLQVYESAIASLHGAMGGMIDSKKLPKDAMNIFREIHE